MKQIRHPPAHRQCSNMRRSVPLHQHRACAKAACPRGGHRVCTMSELVYTVRAWLPSEGIAQQYIAWLAAGHLGAVVKGGAMSAVAVRIDQPALEEAVSARAGAGAEA